jgi:hypothetical protein
MNICRLFFQFCIIPIISSASAYAADDFDTEHMFGLSEGSEIGSKGDRDLEVSSFGRLGKASGRYSAFSTGVSGKFNTGDDFRISPGISISRYDIGGVPGFIDRNGFAFEGANFEMKYRILRRENAPFGLTVGATPFWSRIDPATGGAYARVRVELFRALRQRDRREQCLCRCQSFPRTARLAPAVRSCLEPCFHFWRLGRCCRAHCRTPLHGRRNPLCAGDRRVVPQQI